MFASGATVQTVFNKPRRTAPVWCCNVTLVTLNKQFFFASTQFLLKSFSHTVSVTSSGSRNVKWITLYICCLWTEMAKILFPGTFCEDVQTCKISAFYPLYSQSYESFSGNHLISYTIKPQDPMNSSCVLRYGSAKHYMSYIAGFSIQRRRLLATQHLRYVLWLPNRVPERF